MGDEYGRAEWRTDEAAASAEAVRRIDAAIASGATVLDFSDLIAMTRLPDELAKAQGVLEIYAGEDRATGAAWNEFAPRGLTDISAMTGLTKLTSLDLSSTSFRSWPCYVTSFLCVRAGEVLELCRHSCGKSAG